MHIFLSLLIVSTFLLLNKVEGQNNCTKYLVYLVIDNENIQIPQDERNDEYLKLNQSIDEFYSVLSKLENIIMHPTLFNTKSFDARMDKEGFVLTAKFYFNSPKYYLKTSLIAACSNEVIAESEEEFQMYPSWNPAQVIRKNLSSLNIGPALNAFIKNQHETKGQCLEVGSGGRIEIDAPLNVKKGETSDLVALILDCDGSAVKNAKVVFNCNGCIATPVSTETDGAGVARTKVKMMSDKIARVAVTAGAKNVYGCHTTFYSGIIMGAFTAFKVKLNLELHSDRYSVALPANLHGVEISGGKTTERITHSHSLILHHRPRKEDIEDGFLIDVGDLDDTHTTAYAYDDGIYRYLKAKSAETSTMKADQFKPLVKDSTEGYEIANFSAEPQKNSPSKIIFFLGSENEPGYIEWDAEYKTSDGETVPMAIRINQDDPNVTWKITDIKDLKSPYQKLISIKLLSNSALEYEEEKKTSKALFGFDVNDVGALLSNEKKQVTIVSGFTRINIKIYVAK